MEAVIFDMDGVLVDSERVYLPMIREMLETHGGHPDEAGLHALGGCNRQIELAWISKVLGVSVEEARRIEDHWFETHPVDYTHLAKPGAAKLLSHLKEAGLKLAVASSSPLASVKRAMAETGLGQYFDYLVSGEQFTRSKPDPEIYNHTRALLGTKKSTTLVVEDSPYGIEAAHAAGLAVLGLSDPELNFDISQADAVISHLSEVARYL